MKFRTQNAPAVTALLVAMMSLPFGAGAQAAPAGATSPTGPVETLPTDAAAKEKLTDSEFVKMAASANLAEIEVAKLAETHSSNKKIKAFAKRMIKDHEAINASLKQVATSNRLQLPSAPASVHTQMIADLAKLSGDDFDRAFVDITKKSHDRTVGLFDNAAGETTLNADLRVFANKQLPMLRDHQKRGHALIQANTATKR